MEHTPEAGRENVCSVPWAAWHADRLLDLVLPHGMAVTRLTAAGGPELTDEAIDGLLGSPVDTPPLESLARGRRRAVVAIDDVTRPTPTARILPSLVDRLNRCGIGDDAITVLVATGAHRRASDRDIRWKLGSVYGRVRAVSHDPHADLLDAGVDLAGTRIRLHPAYLEADLRIGIGAVMPHPFAWFSGGAKVVVPGLADLDVVARSHRFALMGFHGGHDATTNRFRRSIEGAVRTIGLAWILGAVVDEGRRLVGLVAGDLEAAHREAAAQSLAAGGTAAPSRQLDALLLNAYPKDAELLQMEAAFVGLRRGLLTWLKPGAPIVLLGAATEGLGRHDLLGPGGRLYRAPSRIAVLGDHPLMVFAPGVSAEEAHLAFWEGYPTARHWDEVTNWLAGKVPSDAAVGVIPAGPLQLTAPGPATLEARS